MTDNFELDIAEQKVFATRELLRDGIVDLIEKHGSRVTFFVRKSRLKGLWGENTLYTVFVVKDLMED
jgi:hypothetical protein